MKETNAGHPDQPRDVNASGRNEAALRERREAANHLTRRKLLASIGAAGVGIASTGLFGSGTAFAKDKLKDPNCLAVTVADIRAMTDPDDHFLYYVIDRGKEGSFYYDPADATTTDNVGSVLVSSAGKRFKRIIGEAVDVKWFGAIGDGGSHPLSERFATLESAQAAYPHAKALTDEIDWCAIQAAIEYVKTGSAPTTRVYIPKGTYLVNQAIRPEVDNIVVSGTAGSVISLQFDYIALLVNKTTPPATKPEAVYNVTVKDLTFASPNGFGPNNAGIVAFNHCIDLLVDNIRVVGNSSLLTSRQRITNGIATSQGTSGVIRNCVVDGVSKPGYYIANGSRDIRVEGCEARNVSGHLGYQPGMGVSGCDRITFVNCISHNNQGAGLQITTDGFPSPGGTPATNVQVIGGQFYNNDGHGIWMGTNVAGQFPRDVQMIGVDTSGNKLHGVNISAGRRISIVDHTAKGNGSSGIFVDNGARLVSTIDVINPNVYNNATALTIGGVVIRGADRVTIQGGRVFDDQTTKTQDYGIEFFPDGQSLKPANIRILDVQVFGNVQDYALTTVQGANVEAASGYYRIRHEGNPEGNLSAPPGSEYTDASTGDKYIKGTGTGNTGWKQIAVVV
ncbi:right-handed parallel beta-helix repeat-containing protein [Paenibacillus sp. MBLB4367]|uniref:right-handed parallel beta-helix repeat-containing protein n=1 Tax=Paenibacillus sp. MBLB4367 TaxID=3384767 RepID=UPI00390826BD